MTFGQLLHTWTWGYREYSGEQEIHLPKETIHFPLTLAHLFKVRARGEYDSLQGEEVQGKLAFVCSGKKLHLSVHLQQTGVVGGQKKPQKWISAVTQKRTRKWLCSWVADVWAEVKVNFRHFHPHRTIESIRRAEGMGGKTQGRRWEALLGDNRGVLFWHFC